MFCSNCGKALGAVAHIYNNELLCEDCFLKIGADAQANSTATTFSHTILIGRHDDQERANASLAIPADSEPETSESTGTTIPNSATTSSTSNSSSSLSAPIPSSQAAVKIQGGVDSPAHSALLYHGEQILWKRTFSKGIIHREETFTEAITNLRALVVDDKIGAIVRACPLKGCQVVVTNTRRDSTQVRGGYGRYGTFGSTGFSRSSTSGDIQFLMQGNIVLTLHNIRDPFGLKRLVEGSLRSMH